MIHSIIDYFLSPAFRNHLENAYWLAGVVLVIGIFIAAGQLRWAYRQIKQAKETFRLQCRRESYRIAAERCDHFGQHIIPLFQRLESDFKSKGVTILDKSKVTIEGNTIRLNTKDVDKSDESKVNECSMELSILLNAIEGWSVFFITGVADEKVGFLTCGQGFVDMFERLIPIYMMSGSLEDHNKHSQALFFQWRERLGQQKLVKQAKKLATQLDTSKLQFKKPIGA